LKFISVLLWRHNQ